MLNFLCVMNLFLSATAWGLSGLTMKRDGGSVGAAARRFWPKTTAQHNYWDSLQNQNNTVVVCTGPAGTGKTAIACHYAMDQFQKGAYKRIILTRPLVTVEEDIGYLPGSLVSKMEPWTRPMMDIFQEYMPASIINNMIKENQIEIAPLAFMRGRTFKDAVVICDEMQNTSPNQMLMVATRVGENSKMIITGDLEQTDVAKNGLRDFLDRLFVWGAEGVHVAQLNKEDIVRHPVVGNILRLYETPRAARPRAPAADDCAMIPAAEVERIGDVANPHTL